MNRARIWLILNVLLFVGLLEGCKSATTAKSSRSGDTPQINNAELKVGDLAPDFRLADHKGGYVRLSDFKGKSNVVIAFFPAAFTPV